MFVNLLKKSEWKDSNTGCVLGATISRRLLLLFQRGKCGFLTKQLVVLCGKTKNIHKIVRPPLRLWRFCLDQQEKCAERVWRSES